MERQKNKTPEPEPASATPRPGIQHQAGTAEAIPPPLTIEAKYLGLKVLAQPEETDEIDVDIVAVHGLAVHPIKTWFHSKTRVNWLSDKTMLPAAIPKARIMAFGYKSYWFGDDAVHQSIDAVSGQLLTALDDKRKGCRHRPIIFIGHCFGGLVIQRAYQRAISDKHLYPGTSDSITGIAFLGTPHRGVVSSSSLQTQGQIYQAIARAKLHIQDNVLHTMAQDNDLLVQIVHDFTSLISRQGDFKPALFCFFEQMACKVGLIAGMPDMPKEFIVGQSSATFDTCPKEGLALDHFGMNKFEDDEDGSYDQVRRQLVKMVENSHRIMDGRGLEKTPLPTGLSRALSARKHHHLSLPIPIEREAHFALRGDVLELLEIKFQETVTLALSGAMGNGKTHVAVEYAHRFYREHPGSHIHWVDAGSAEQFELSFKRIAETLHLRSPGTQMRAGQEVTEEVYHALKRDINSPWLLVLDGLSDESTLQGTGGLDEGMRKLLDFIPKPPLARVLVTTRSKALAMRLVNRRDEYVVDIPALKDDDAALVLLGKVSSDEAKVKRAAGVSRMLGGSAGALTFAHHYRRVVDRHCPWSQYMEKIRQSAPLTSETGTTAVVMRAWQLLYEPLREKHPETASLLRFIGVLDVQSIPRGFFSKSEFTDHVRRLIKYGLVEPTADQRVLRVTAIVRRCVQTFLKETGERDLYSVEQERVLSLMSDKFDGEDPDTAELLLPIVLATLKFQPTSQDAKRLVATLLFRVAHYYARVGKPETAMQHLERCLDQRKQDPEDRNRDLIQQTERAIEDARSQLSLPRTEKTDQAKFEAGKGAVAAVRGPSTKRLGQELKQLEQSGGKDHADTIRKVSELAAAKLTTHSDGSGSKDAAALYRRALAWCKKNHGDNNMDTARLQYNLALAREERGEYDEAKVLYLSASQTVEQHLGPGSPELLRILRSLALLHCRRRDLGAATRGLVAVLHGQDKALGYNHPDTLVTRQNIAMLLEEKGQVDAAGEELERVVGVQTYLLGRDDPATLQTSCSLAMNYRLRGRPEDAETLFRATLKTQQKTLGKNHRDTVTTDLMLRELLQSTARAGA